MTVGADLSMPRVDGVLGFQLVTCGVTDIEDVDRILADGEDDPVLVHALAAPAVEQFADFLG